MRLIKALLGGGRENGVTLCSLSVVCWKCDDSSALRYCKEEHFELVDVMFFHFLNQVGRKCKDSAVFWNHYEVISKFVCDVLPWNQEHIYE
jgi:hypothetical protein